jgi:alpha-ketoglutarate-dependent taurine dioxygenase
MDQITITPVENKGFGAVVGNVDVANLNENEFQQINTALVEFGFLVFHEQFLNDEENIAFGQRFGELQFGAAPMANQQKLDDGTYGEIFQLNTQRMRTNVGNEAWHTDSTYVPISSKCAMLSAVTVPSEAGETELADMRSGYAALDQATKDRIEHLSAYHSAQYSQANDVADFPAQDPEGIYHGEAYLRPLVKIHPETGVKNLFIGRHAFGIPGLTRVESRELLKYLVEFVTSEDTRVYTHKWQVGDTLLWDNRALLHRALAYDYNEARVLTGTRVAGDPASELAYYPTDEPAQAGRDALAAELQMLREEHGGKKFGELESTAMQDA